MLHSLKVSELIELGFVASCYHGVARSPMAEVLVMYAVGASTHNYQLQRAHRLPKFQVGWRQREGLYFVHACLP